MSAPRRRAPALAWAGAAFGLSLLWAPLVVLAVTSFQHSGQGAGEGWGLYWYRKALSNAAVLDALGVSAWVAFWTTLVATAVGTGAALAITRWRFPGRKVLDAAAYLPLVVPEIVTGLSLLAWFVVLRLTLGTFSVILAHVTFTLSYVILAVKARLLELDPLLEEAAADLGADSWQTFWRVIFPLILPAVASGAVMAFTLSFDDFIVTFFTSGAGADTLPMKIYAMIKFGVSPEINALSTLLLAATAALGLVAGVRRTT